ncbi:MAG TPA: HAD family phosphatase, partial [Rhizomicrobium sp.]|nr:HAD family phosphatase [Rhizomicrobium sp.]
ETQQVSSRWSQDDPYKRHERGTIDANAYFASLRNSLGIDLSDEQFLDGWNAIFAGVVPGIEEQLRMAGKRWPLYVFSNTNPAHEAHFIPAYADTLKHFRKLYLSSSIGLRKPDRAAFEYVAHDIGVAPANILFFDDVLENVEGARAAGFQAIQALSSADVAAALADLP